MADQGRDKATAVVKGCLLLGKGAGEQAPLPSSFVKTPGDILLPPIHES